MNLCAAVSDSASDYVGSANAVVADAIFTFHVVVDDVIVP